MFQAASFTSQRKLAADYRETDIRQATRERAEAEAKGSGDATLDTTNAAPTAGAITRLLTFRPHAR